MAEKTEAGEELAMLRRRLRYRAWHRGTREMDLVLGPFADAHAETMGREDLQQLEQLMDEPDTELLKWVMAQEVPPARVDAALLARLKAFAVAIPPPR